MKSFVKAVAAFGLVALLATPAWAQGRGGMFGGPAALLANTGVQKEIKATDDQVSKLNTLSEDVRGKQREAFQGLQDLSQEERREKMTEVQRKMRDEVHKGLSDILKPDQVKRFKQIELQAGGANAFAMPQVADELKLTDDQKAKIRSINEDTMQSMREAFQSAGGDREAAMQKMAEIRKEASQKAVNVLTDSQKRQWKDMTGAPYEVKFEPPRQNN